MNSFSASILLPFECILPLIAILLINFKSPVQALIYRSFLGTISALLYSLMGAPDVALTEVLVGTLLSTLLYIVSIRGCYSLIVIVENNESIDNNKKFTQIRKRLKRLNFHLVIKKVPSIPINSLGKIDWDCINTFSGSPHAAYFDNKLYVESKILKDELINNDSTEITEIITL